MPELAEGVRLEIACAGKTGTVGSNPTLSAMIRFFDGKKRRRPSAKRPDIEVCAYCPKLCHASCPVSLVTASETLSPWGKQTILFEVERSILPMSPEYTDVFYACLECHRCTTFCEHGVDVPRSLRHGRRRAFESRTAPPPVAAMREKHSERERLARTVLEEKFPLFDHGAGRQIVLMPGCVTALRDLHSVECAVTAIHRLAGEELGMASRLCCGLPLLHAGDIEGFRVAARRMAEALRSTKTLVVMDPGCAHTLIRHYAEHGVGLETNVVTFAEFAAGYVNHFRGKVRLPQPAFYHDPCHLGRDLGVYAQPRDILMKIVAGGIRDIHYAREQALCCGGGGALPETMPAVAEAIAARTASVFVKAGASSVVTACPTCKAMIARGAPSIAVHDIADLVVESL
jgi:Fe-S oxidoreductase